MGWPGSGLQARAQAGAGVQCGQQVEGPQRERDRRERISTPSGDIWGLGGDGSCTYRGFSEIPAVSSTLFLNHSKPYTTPGADAVTITLLTVGGAEAQVVSS